MYLWEKMIDIEKNSAPQKEAIVEEGVSLTYKDLIASVFELIKVFSSNQIGERSVVCSFTSSPKEIIVTLLACDAVNAIFVPVEISATAEEQIALLSNFENFHLVSNAIDVERFAIKPHSHIYLKKEKIVEVSISPLLQANEKLKDIHLVLFSSGSTGKPKGILISNTALLDRSLHLSQALGLTATDRTLCSVPLSHSHGLECLSLTTLIAGGTLYFLPPSLSYPKSVFKFIENNRITFYSNIPDFYKLSLKTVKPSEIDISSIRLLFCGSAALSSQTAIQFHDQFKIPINQGYGLTEIAVICIAIHNNRESILYDSVGKPLPPIEYFITEEGELRVRSTALFSGYIINKEILPRKQDSFLETGDLVKQDLDKNIFINGRKEDFVNVVGFKIYLSEVEQALEAIEEVNQAAVVAKKGTEELIAFVTLSSSFEKITSDDILKKLRQSVSSYKIPKELKIIDKFPKSALGKIMKNKLITD